MPRCNNKLFNFNKISQKDVNWRVLTETFLFYIPFSCNIWIQPVAKEKSQWGLQCEKEDKSLPWGFT